MNHPHWSKITILLEAIHLHCNSKTLQHKESTYEGLWSRNFLRQRKIRSNKDLIKILQCCFFGGNESQVEQPACGSFTEIGPRWYFKTVVHLHFLSKIVIDPQDYSNFFIVARSVSMVSILSSSSRPFFWNIPKYMMIVSEICQWKHVRMPG